MEEKNNKITNEELLEAINEGFSQLEVKTDARFNKIEAEMAGMVTKDYLEMRLAQTETKMVTKAYLDDKLADLRGDLVVLARQEDKKLVKLVDILHDNKTIDKKEKNEILAMEPFPDLGLTLKQ